MPAKRPTGVFVLAIISFVYGGLLLVCGVCTGGAIALQGSEGLKNMQGAGMPEKERAKQRELMERIERTQKEHMPNANLIQLGQAAAQIVFAGMLIFGAFGLLKMRSWGRLLHVVYAAAAILLQIAMLIYTLLVVLPANDAMMKAMTEEMTGPQKQMMESMKGISALGGPIALAGAFVWLIYPIAVLVVLFWPTNAAAFRRARGVVDDERDDRRPEDTEDEYGWRRGE